MNNSITIKTERNLRVTFAVHSAVLFSVCAEVAGSILLIINKDWYDFAMLQVVVLGFIVICLMGFVLAEIVNRKKIVVTEDEIIKYKGKNIVFKINKSNIVELTYKKSTIAMRLLFPLGILMQIPFVGMLSIRYKSADVDEPRAAHSYEILDTLSEEDKQAGLKEYLELLGAREMKKISKLLKVKVNYV